MYYFIGKFRRWRVTGLHIFFVVLSAEIMPKIIKYDSRNSILKVFTFMKEDKRLKALTLQKLYEHAVLKLFT